MSSRLLEGYVIMRVAKHGKDTPKGTPTLCTMVKME